MRCDNKNDLKRRWKTNVNIYTQVFFLLAMTSKLEIIVKENVKKCNLIVLPFLIFSFFLLPGALLENKNIVLLNSQKVFTGNHVAVLYMYVIKYRNANWKNLIKAFHLFCPL